MADISNKFLVFLLVIAILVSIIGTWYSIDRIGKLASITGADVYGYVNVTFGAKTEINVTQPYCGFGSGYVTPGNNYAALESYKDNVGLCSGPGAGGVPTNWTNTTVYDPQCMIIQNLGTTTAEINVSSGKNTDTFIGGNSTHNDYRAWSEDKDSGACTSGLQTHPGTEMDTNNKTMCANMSNSPGTDEIYVGCYLIVPKDAPIEAKTDTWTFTADAG